MRAQQPYDPIQDARSQLRLIGLQANGRGLSARDAARELRQRMPTLVNALSEHLLTDWVRREFDRLRDSSKLPLFRSVGERYVQRSFWDENAYREVIERYVSQAQQGLGIAQMLAEECYRVHGVRIAVPSIAI